MKGGGVSRVAVFSIDGRERRRGNRRASTGGGSLSTARHGEKLSARCIVTCSSISAGASFASLSEICPTSSSSCSKLQ